MLFGGLCRSHEQHTGRVQPTYFVLEETDGMPTSAVVLRQFRRHEDALTALASLVLSELELSSDDVVADISGRYARFGFELLFATPVEDESDSSASSGASQLHQRSNLTSQRPVGVGVGGTTPPAVVIRALRLAVPDAEALERWVDAFGAAITKLTLQDKAARLNSVGIPDVSSQSALRAKVAPILSTSSENNSSSSDEEQESECVSDRSLLCEEIRQAEEHQSEAADDDEEEKLPSRALTVAQAPECRDHRMGASPAARGFDDADVELGQHEPLCKPLRRCRSCDQWMPFDCDNGEQMSCCSHDSEVSSDCGDEDNNACDNGASSKGDDNQVDDDNDAETYSRLQSQHSSCVFVSPQSSSSSATSFTPSESPNGVALGGMDTSRMNAFANFVVSPNPPVQLTGSPLSPSHALLSSLYAKRELESELKASSASTLTRVSSEATAFLRSRFTRGSSSGSIASPTFFQLPPTHSFTANGQVFTLDTRYTLIKSIGTGAYGAVIAVQDAAADVSVAVKKITNIFEDLVDAKRILREVRLLHHFQHKNITELLDLSPPPSKHQFDDMYIITELMETDLHQVIYSRQAMSDDHVKYFLYQMLCALHHIHSAGVIHRDMKPSNVLLNSNCDLKICDFGLARGGMPPPSAVARRREELTEYVVTRWYRAPEIMLNCLEYTEAIDVWAVGCIFAEMLLREPLLPGNDYVHQLKLIVKLLGTPEQEDMAFVKNAKALRFLTKLAISKPKKWHDVFAGTDEDVNPLAVDLLSQMLHFNPAKRISVDHALRHPYLATFFDPADITSAREFDFSFDLPDDKLTKEALVDLLCEDIAHFHPIRTARAPVSSSSRFFSMGTTASAS